MNRHLALASLGLALAAGCDATTAPESQPPERFGALTALIDGHAWVSSYFPDSTVAFYDPASGELQVFGQEVRPDGWPSLRVRINRGAAPGAFRLGTFADPAFGEWYEPPSTDRARGDQGPRGFLSIGAPGDSLVIEELDPTTRQLRGHFSFSARLLRATDEVHIVARFAGRFLVP